MLFAASQRRGPVRWADAGLGGLGGGGWHDLFSCKVQQGPSVSGPRGKSETAWLNTTVIHVTTIHIFGRD